MELRPFRALRGNPAFKERRPGLWVDRQVLAGEGQTGVVPLLIGLVRLSESGDIALADPPASPESVSKRVGALVTAKADSEPCLLVARAPLPASFLSMRRPDFSVAGKNGGRHDFVRINDYAQHVELQGLVKNVEAQLREGRELWEAARQFAISPAAAKLPGAKFKLCAILDEAFAGATGLETPRGILGYSFEDPVY
jgi:hypothetical protein